VTSDGRLPDFAGKRVEAIAPCARRRSAITARTHAVHVGSRSTAGIHSATNVGSSSGWKPMAQTVSTKAATSIA